MVPLWQLDSKKHVCLASKVINKLLPLKVELLWEFERENLDSCMRFHVGLHGHFYVVSQMSSILCAFGL